MRFPELKWPERPNPSSGAPNGGVSTASENAQLTERRDRLTEQFALMQSELGGLFYEMAIRDHVQLDVLIDRAAALQRVDSEIRQVELMIGQGKPLAGQCPNCGTTYARGASFCSSCAAVLPSN